MATPTLVEAPEVASTAIPLPRPVAPSTKRQQRKRPPLFIAAIVSVLVLLALVPLGFIVWVTASIGWSNSVELVFRERVYRLLLNTVLLVVCTIPISVLLGVGSAWLVERSTMPARRLVGTLLAIPLAIPAFVGSYSWISIFPSLNGLPAGVLISVLSYFPLVYLPAAASLRRLDPAVEESARSLGMSPSRTFVRIVLPQLRLAVLGGSLLIGLHLLAEYGAYSMIRFSTFTTAIVEQYQSTFNGAAGSMLAGVLVVLCLLLLSAEASARGGARYARIGSGAPRTAAPVDLGKWTLPAMGAVIAVLGGAIGVPAYVVARWLNIGGVAVWRNPEISAALGQTLAYAVVGASVCVAAALPIAWIAVRYPGPFAKWVEGSNYVASSLPGIVVALALTTVTIRVFPQVYQTVWVVFAAYVLMYIPRALVTVRAGLSQSPIELEEAARSLGRSPLLSVWTVTLRRLLPSLGAAAALVFLAVINELTATLLLSPSGTATLATRFWAYSAELDYAAAAPFAAIMIVFSLPMTFLLLRQARTQQ